MQFEIEGRLYDGNAQPFIGDLRLLKKEFGFGWGTVAKTLSSIDVESNLIDLLDDDAFLDAFIAWLWMSRLRAGDRGCTRAEIEMLALDQVQLITDDDDGEADATPTSAPTDSDRGDDVPEPVATRTRASTKTSKPRSTRASS